MKWLRLLIIGSFGCFGDCYGRCVRFGFRRYCAFLARSESRELVMDDGELLLGKTVAEEENQRHYRESNRGNEGGDVIEFIKNFLCLTETDSLLIVPSSRLWVLSS